MRWSHFRGSTFCFFDQRVEGPEEQRSDAVLNQPFTMLEVAEGDAMNSEKNLHASIPPALLAEAQAAASADHISMDDLVREAMERRLRQRQLRDLYAYGDQQARKLGLNEDDVERIIHEFRQEEREQQNKAH
jgi:hypothetical protein